MEKFRHFGDAATGINPFTFVIAPTTLSRAGATVMFPMRLLFAAVFGLLLLLTDTLLWLLHCLYLGLLGRLLLAPLQRAWLRALLFFIGHILPDQPPSAIAQPHRTGGAGTTSAAAAAVTTPRQVCAGDVVVCNLQSVWDIPVLEVMLTQPYRVVCFPDVTAAAAAGAMESCAGTYPGLRVFWPGPLQRWAIMRHVRRTGTLAFLTAQTAEAKKVEGELPLNRVQAAAAKAGLSVWWFGEGTCSNGKGLLTMPAVVCRTASSSSSGSGVAPPSSAPAECVAYVATVQYNTPAVQNVVGSDVVGLFRLLFQTGVLLYGSAAPAWSSPFFPTAEVTFRPVRLTRAVVSHAAEGAKANAKASPVNWTVGTAALLELRNAMCQRGQALVVSGGAAVRRQPLSVGMKEKKGFVEAYLSMVQKE